MKLLALAEALATVAIAIGGTHAADGPRQVEWRNSGAVGLPEAGSLERGVMLPSEGRTWVTWDPVERDKPNRWWRRWGTDRLVRALLARFATMPPHTRALRGSWSATCAARTAGTSAPATGRSGMPPTRTASTSTSTTRGPTAGNGPRGYPSRSTSALSQDLVDRFVAAGAERRLVGPSLPLTGPPGVVVPLVNHDNHLHFRLPPDQ